MAAEQLLDLFCSDVPGLTDDVLVRRFSGAFIVVMMWRELTLIRRILTKAFSKTDGG
jgi:hypothetical protein